MAGMTQELWLNKLETEILPKCREWMDAPPKGKESFLILAGPVGTGKTSAALKMGVPRSRWTDIVNDWSVNEWSPAIHAYGCGMLDDVRDCGNGKYAIKPGDVFEQIIDKVEAGPGLRLIITTNLRTDELRAFAGERAFDRLRGRGVMVPFVGVSLRGMEAGPQLQITHPRAAKMTAERAHEIVWRVAEANGPARRIMSAMAAKKAEANEPPFNGDQAKWPEWKREWVAEGKAVISSGGPRINKAMGKSFMAAYRSTVGG